MASKNLYQILQVDRAADPEIIEAAYRRLARLYHPDINPSPDAVSRMQEINQAYGVLRDPMQRQRYDRLLLEQEATKSTSSSHQTSTSNAGTASTPPQDGSRTYRTGQVPDVPRTCEMCGVTNSSLRIAQIPYVISAIFVTFRRGWSGLYCESCRRELARQAKIISLILGWWGIPFGPIYTLDSVFMPGDGNQPPEENAAYLRALATYFWYTGQHREAQQTLKASLAYRYDKQTQDLYDSVFGKNSRVYDNNGSDAGRSSTSSDADGRSGGSKVPIMIVLGVPLVLFFLSMFSRGSDSISKQPTVESSTSAAVASQPQQEPENTGFAIASKYGTAIPKQTLKPVRTPKPTRTPIPVAPNAPAPGTYEGQNISLTYPIGMKAIKEEDGYVGFTNLVSNLRVEWFDTERPAEDLVQDRESNTSNYIVRVSALEKGLREFLGPDENIKDFRRAHLNTIGKNPVITAVFKAITVNIDSGDQPTYTVYVDFLCGEHRICSLLYDTYSRKYDEDDVWRLLVETADSIAFVD